MNISTLKSRYLLYRKFPKVFFIHLSNAIKHIKLSSKSHLKTFFERYLKTFFKKVFNIATLASKIVLRQIIGGILVNLVGIFYPEFSTKFPVIYGWFDWWLQFGELTLQAVLAGIYSLVMGNSSECFTKYVEAFIQLFQTLLDLISTL